MTHKFEECIFCPTCGWRVDECQQRKVFGREGGQGCAYEVPYYGSSSNMSMEMLEQLQDKLYDPLRRTDAFSDVEAVLKEAAGYR